MRKLTNRDLERRHAHNNRVYFNGELKHVSVRFASDKELFGDWGMCTPDGMELLINRRLANVEFAAYIILLHEENHARFVRNGHGFIWAGGIADLMMQGAYDELL